MDECEEEEEDEEDEWMLLEKTRTPQLGCGELKVSLRIYRRPHKVLEAT